LIHRKTILVLPYTPTLSHVSRSLETAKELRRSGYRVIFAGFRTRQSKIPFIEQEGFSCYPLFEPDPGILFGNIRAKKFEFVSASVLKDMVKSDVSLFNRLKPDLVLSDGRFSAMISTQICGAPHAAIVNASSTSYRSIPYVPLFDNFIFDRLCQQKSLKNLFDKVNLIVEMSIFDQAMREFKRLCTRYRLKTAVTATNCLAGKDLTLLADIPEYFPVKNKPENYHYIGPVTWEASKQMATPKWWPVPETAQPQIYITMGTTGDGGLFSKIYEQFKHSGMVSIVTTGSQSDFETIPGVTYVTDFMNGKIILANTDIVVCHGGNGTIYQALSMGKPVIGIPSIPDQDFNMRRVEAMGLGIRIRMKDALENPLCVVQAAEYVIENNSRYRKKLNAVQARIQKYSGARMAAEIIKDFLG